MSSPITTHVLDTASGEPARDLHIALHRQRGDDWIVEGGGITNEDGRIADLLDRAVDLSGRWRMIFHTGPWLKKQGRPVFYPVVQVEFEVPEGVGSEAHYHVPLLLSPFGYSTYRGS